MNILNTVLHPFCFKFILIISNSEVENGLRVVFLFTTDLVQESDESENFATEKYYMHILKLEPVFPGEFFGSYYFASPPDKLGF